MTKKKIGLDTGPENAPPPAMPGGLPLPVGQPVPVNAKTLTPKEKQDLEAIGWKPGMPIPDNLAELIEQVTKEATDPASMPPPVDPATPPLQVPRPVDLQDLPEEKRAVLQEALQQAARQQASPQPAAMPQQPGEGVVEAIQAAQGVGGKEIRIENDLDEKPAAPPPQPPPLESPEEAPRQAPSAETAPEHEGACPYCGWDLSIRDVVEVSESDKDVYAAARLGGRGFQKVYELLGGRLQITFRELYIYEIDACYRRCYLDRKAGKIVTASDFSEELHRYQLALQIAEIRGGEDLTQFPESLKEWGDPGDDELLVRVRDKVFGEVLRTESMLRIVSGSLFHFRRLLARLEANADRPDFYRAAAPAS